MRSLWKGAISFGLVNVPVRMYAATDRQDIKFNYLHRVCGTPIRYRKMCPLCEQEVSQEDIVRGYQYAKDQFVVLTEDELARPENEEKAINILDFVELAQIDPVYYDKTYYLEPAEGGKKAYHLLLKAMEEAGKAAIAKVVIRSKEVIAAIRVYGQVLAMETMFYNDEVRSISQLTGLEPVQVDERELKMALELINNMATDFRPEGYRDTYRAALLERIEAKIQGRQITTPPQPQEEKVSDLLAALEASLKATAPAGGRR
ncbi:MAG TPA: Ku protein [Bacillota bacterium]|nr:Ku protein [Bacillota bacterium]HPT62435.1 Ku protein [Bacillota bacterium]